MACVKHLRLNQIATIAKLVRQLPLEARPTWSDVISIAKSVTSIEYTRQTLQSKNKIRDAYGEKVDEYRKFKKQGHRAPYSADKPISMIAKLRSQVEALNLTLEEYDQTIVKITFNALSRGLSIDELMLEIDRLPKIHTDK